MRILAIVIVLVGWTLPLAAQVPSGLPLSKSGSPGELAGTLRNLLLDNMPPVLLDDQRDWGHQKLVTRGIEWKGAGNALPQRQKSYKNDGVWRKIRIATAGNLRESLVFDLRDVQKPAPDRMTFLAFVAFDARADFDQQNWRSGLMTYAGSVRTRFRVRLTLLCEVSSRWEKGKGFLPEVIFRARVLQAQLGYDDLVVEHVSGVGGELAKLIGGAAHAFLNQLRPSIERDLLTKANAAIVKAADTKDVRLGFSKLIK